MCKHCVGSNLVLRFLALIAHAFLNRSICTNRHVHQDQYVVNGFHLSQDVVLSCHILSERTFFLLTLYITLLVSVHMGCPPLPFPKQTTHSLTWVEVIKCDTKLVYLKIPKLDSSDLIAQWLERQTSIMRSWVRVPLGGQIFQI